MRGVGEKGTLSEEVRIMGVGRNGYDEYGNCRVGNVNGVEEDRRKVTGGKI